MSFVGVRKGHRVLVALGWDDLLVLQSTKFRRLGKSAGV